MEDDEREDGRRLQERATGQATSPKEIVNGFKKEEMVGKWCSMICKPSKTISDSLSRVAAVAARLVVMSVRPLAKDRVALSPDHHQELVFAFVILCHERRSLKNGSKWLRKAHGDRGG